jgi:hypothetical protein
MSVNLFSSGRDQPQAIPPKHLRDKGRICGMTRTIIGLNRFEGDEMNIPRQVMGSVMRKHFHVLKRQAGL